VVALNNCDAPADQEWGKYGKRAGKEENDCEKQSAGVVVRGFVWQMREIAENMQRPNLRGGFQNTGNKLT
jgi:hypothetical protein